MDNNIHKTPNVYKMNTKTHTKNIIFLQTPTFLSREPEFEPVSEVVGDLLSGTCMLPINRKINKLVYYG